MWALVFILSVSDADVQKIGVLETREQCVEEVTRLIEESSYTNHWACILNEPATGAEND